MSSLVIKHGEMISNDILNTISTRYHTITAAINKEFWNSTSSVSHTLYVGSYGRGTAIDTSDVDVLAILPESEYNRYDYLKGNGQSRLLQAVKNAILNSYPRTSIHADGQVVIVQFTDGIKFEVVPAFEKHDYFGGVTYIYPDTNNGGNWKSTNPKAEQEAMKDKNKSSNGLLKDTCKHIRTVRDTQFSSYHLPGILIDSFVFNAMGNWRWTPPNEEGSSSAAGTYEQVLLDYYNSHKWSTLIAPGSNQFIDTGSYDILEKVLKYMVG